MRYGSAPNVLRKGRWEPLRSIRSLLWAGKGRRWAEGWASLVKGNSGKGNSSWNSPEPRKHVVSAPFQVALFGKSFKCKRVEKPNRGGLRRALLAITGNLHFSWGQWGAIEEFQHGVDLYFIKRWTWLQCEEYSRDHNTRGRENHPDCCVDPVRYYGSRD